MKTRASLVAIVMLLPVPALAQLPPPPPGLQGMTAQTMGPFTYYNGTTQDGGMVNGMSQQMGPFTYSHFTGPDGQMTNCTTQQLGVFQQTNCQ